MAAYLGVNATLVAAGGLSTLTSGLVDGRVKCMLDYYTILGTETAGATITLGGLIPKNANVIAIILKVTANQTSVTVDIGDDEDADRYAAASTSLQTAGTYVWSANNYICDETTASTTDRQIVITTAAATMSAGVLYAAIFYSID